jgi:hypothetical protein
MKRGLQFCHAANHERSEKHEKFLTTDGTDLRG